MSRSAAPARAPDERRRRTALWVAVAAYLALIFFLSSLPNPLPALTSRVSDKVLHLVEYGGLCLLLGAALRLSGVRAGRATALALLLGSLYGASDEFHQAFVPNRSCDVRDWLADTAGAALGALAASRLRLRQRAPGGA
jgi:VanZ family protein